MIEKVVEGAIEIISIDTKGEYCYTKQTDSYQKSCCMKKSKFQIIEQLAKKNRKKILQKYNSFLFYLIFEKKYIKIV